MDAVSSHRTNKRREKGEEEEWQGRAAGLSHRSAFCGMCRLIMLKANNNNNKSNKWLQLSMRQKRRQTRRTRMVIDTTEGCSSLANPLAYLEHSARPAGKYVPPADRQLFQCPFSASFQCGKANKTWQENCQRSEPEDDDDDDDAHRHNVTIGQCAVPSPREIFINTSCLSLH